MKLWSKPARESFDDDAYKRQQWQDFLLKEVKEQADGEEKVLPSMDSTLERCEELRRARYDG